MDLADGPARRLRRWILIACCLSALVGAAIGFGMLYALNRGAEDAPSSWYERYASRLKGEFGLSERQYARLLQLLADYDRQERKIRGEYVREMEVQEGRLVGLSRQMTHQLCTELFTAQQRAQYEEQLLAKESRQIGAPRATKKN